MITGEVRNKVDKIWKVFRSGGITNPLTAIEQFTYLLFIKGLDEQQSHLEANASVPGIEPERIFGDDQQQLRRNFFRIHNDHRLSRDQMEFMQRVVGHIIENDSLDKTIRNNHPFNKRGSVVDLFDGKLDIAKEIDRLNKRVVVV
jgi:hypothetical protein